MRLDQRATRKRTGGEIARRTHVDLGGVAASRSVNPDRCFIFHLHWWLRVLVLVSDYIATLHRLAGRATHRVVGRDSVYLRDRSAACGRLELGSTESRQPTR